MQADVVLAWLPARMLIKQDLLMHAPEARMPCEAEFSSSSNA